MFTIERAERLLLTIGGRTMRHFYALSDSSTGDNPTNYTQGSANTKEPIAFPSKTARDRWVEATRLLTAKAITRAEAIRWADTWPVLPHGGHAKAIRLHGAENVLEGCVIVKVAEP